jgi:hypothetical protein
VIIFTSCKTYRTQSQVEAISLRDVSAQQNICRYNLRAPYREGNLSHSMVFVRAVFSLKGYLIYLLPAIGIRSVATSLLGPMKSYQSVHFIFEVFLVQSIQNAV